MRLIKSNIWLILTGIISLFVIFYKFSTLPQNLAFDEVEFGRLALMLKSIPYTPYHPYATGHSTLYFYFILVSFMTLGVSEFALRLPAGLFGILAIWFFYRIMQMVFSKRELPLEIAQGFQIINHKFSIPFAFILALLLATSRWYFNFARFAFEPTFLVFLELASLYFAMQFSESRKKSQILLSGIFAGLAYNSYIPGRIFFLVPFLFVLIVGKEKLRSAFIYIAAFIIVILPLTSYLIQHQDIRIDQQLYPVNSELALRDKTEFFRANVFSNIAMLYVPKKGDGNGRHNYPLKPALNPVLFAFFIIGFYIGIKNYTHRANAVFSLYLFLAFIPTLFTYPWENPNMLRTYTMLPSIIYFAGVGLLTVYKRVQMSIKRQLLRNYAIVFLFILLVLSSLYELRTYFVYQARYVIPYAFDIEDGIGRVSGKL